MPFDGITSHLLARELDSRLAGSRIDKVFQPDRQTLILHIRANARMEKLLISCNPASVRMNLTSADRENPKMPPSFCMLLRKYLSGARIESVTCPSYERIIEIRTSTTDELHDPKTYTLICELMGRYSNVILVSSTNKIIDSLVHVDISVNRYREVMPARIYEYPPQQDKYTPEQAKELIKDNKLPIRPEQLSRPLEKALINSVKGLSPALTRRLISDLRTDDRTAVKDLDPAVRDLGIKTIGRFLDDVSDNKTTPAVYCSEDGSPAEYLPFLFGHESNTECFDTICEAIDAFYRAKDRTADLERKKQRITAIVDTALSHAVRKLEIHEKDLEDGGKADYYKKCADLILSNTYRIESHSSSFTCEDYYSDPPAMITIALDPVTDASSNAQSYYRRFRKSKRKYELAEEYIKADKEAVSYFRSLKAAASSASCEEDIEALEREIASFTETSYSKKKENVNRGDPNRSVGMAKSGKHASRAMREAARKAAIRNRERSQRKAEPAALSYRRYKTSDGYEILSGRNNIQNDELTFRIASKDDWWFHIKGLPGTHVILRSRKGEEFPSDNAVIEAASLAAFFSKSIMVEEHSEGRGSHAGSIKAEVDYCPVSHVRKIPGARPGMVIYENYYSVLVEAKEPGVPNNL
ncbi:MAG: NFACT family protein [Clostridiales bacterium]|nr:NFACT family protein [Clostridiales bacterium]